MTLMTMETISFQVSQDLLAALKVGSLELTNNLRLLAAITYFQDKKLSLGKAAELAGINRLEFMDILAAKAIIIFDYDESVIESEIQGISHL
jgi:predicted HTH domain antitoxin